MSSQPEVCSCLKAIEVEVVVVAVIEVVIVLVANLAVTVVVTVVGDQVRDQVIVTRGIKYLSCQQVNSKVRVVGDQVIMTRGIKYLLCHQFSSKVRDANYRIGRLNPVRSRAVSVRAKITLTRRYICKHL